jgi:hypothetical protein
VAAIDDAMDNGAIIHLEGDDDHEVKAGPKDGFAAVWNGGDSANNLECNVFDRP